MGERKVLNKYFPPDFDPSLVPRRKRPKNEQIEVRMMLPFSLQCATCGEYMYRGKKFNSRKEEVLGEDYHGIRIFRFYIKCITCSAEITFKTDPQRGDYAAEHGCQRNFEPWRATEDAETAAAQAKAAEEKGDATKALENRTLDSKREMDLLDALDEIKAINQRHARVDTDALLRQNREQAGAEREQGEDERRRQDEEDQARAREVFAKAKQQQQQQQPPPPQTVGKKRPVALAEADRSGKAAATPVVAPAVVVVRKKAVAGKKKDRKKAPAKPAASLVADYSDSD